MLMISCIRIITNLENMKMDKIVSIEHSLYLCIFSIAINIEMTFYGKLFAVKS